jgi:hypothetical protein
MIISVLSLVVAILAVLFGPLMAWTVALRQITVAARAAWLREFREKVAALLYAYDKFVIYATTGEHTTGDPEKNKKT